MSVPRTLAVVLISCGGFATAACRTTSTRLDVDPLVAIQSVDVAYAGELHSDPAHHAYQLRMLEALVEAGRRDGTPVLLGMEMFQQPFQQHLDDYVAGRIPEREMLRRTEYFERWRFDHTMYAPLWQLCRANGVRIVALNAEAGLVRAVSRGGGVASLTPEQRAQIPAEIDLTNEAHRRRIMAEFQDGAHPLPEEELQGMYEAMTVWDEAMAESAAAALADAGPGSRMLVIAGSQHIQQFTGIPDRVTARLPHTTRAVVVLRTEGREDEDAPPDAELGDAVVRLGAIPAAPPARLGVMIQNDPLPEGLLITGVVDHSNADRAGLLAGDVLQWVGPARITDMTDLRYTLDRTSIGTTVELRVLRGGRPLTTELTFAVPPQQPEG
jgi:uncharacterized iron-regulated protein